MHIFNDTSTFDVQQSSELLIIIVRIMYSFQMGSAQFFHQNSIIFSEVFLSFGATDIYHMYM